MSDDEVDIVFRWSFPLVGFRAIAELAAPRWLLDDGADVLHKQNVIEPGHGPNLVVLSPTSRSPSALHIPRNSLFVPRAIPQPRHDDQPVFFHP